MNRNEIPKPNYEGKKCHVCPPYGVPGPFCDKMPDLISYMKKGDCGYKIGQTIVKIYPSSYGKTYPENFATQYTGFSHSHYGKGNLDDGEGQFFSLYPLAFYDYVGAIQSHTKSHEEKRPTERGNYPGFDVLAGVKG